MRFTKSTSVLVVVVSVIVTICQAQPVTSIKPHLGDWPMLVTDAVVQISAPDAALITATEKASMLPHKMQVFSVSVPAQLDVMQHALRYKVAGGNVYRLVIESAGAKALIPYWDKFVIPNGVAVHLIGANTTLGAFTSQHSTYGKYCTGILPNSAFAVECFVPDNVTESPQLQLGYIGYAYRDVSFVSTQRSTRDFGQSDICQVNVNCSEGVQWADQRQSVVRILINDGASQGWCTGTMMNNKRGDCSPFLLSAQHCSQGSDSLDMLTWVFYFNYQAAGCTNPGNEGNLGQQFITGAQKLAESNDNGGDTGSDFLLMRLNDAPPHSYQVFYSGWDATGTTPANGVCIHHPSGDIKKISAYSSAASSQWGFAAGSHWELAWTATANGHGVTEPGSSGAPLFTAQGRVTGALTGGDSYCDQTDATDLFGKFSYSWTSNGTAANRQLKAWLDPDNTGALTLDGQYAPCTSSINETATAISVALYPNPATDNVLIRLGTSDNFIWTITDLNGKLIKKGTATSETTISVSEMAAGMYWLQCFTAQAPTAATRLVKW